MCFSNAILMTSTAGSILVSTLLRGTFPITYFNDALVLDPENAAAHYSLKQIYADLGDEAGAQRHGQLHLKYKPDDNARDRAIAEARRRYPSSIAYPAQAPGSPTGC